MFCSPELIFGGTEVIVSRFHVLRSPDSFSVVPRASCPVFMFCAPELIFGGTEVVGSRFHVLCSRTRFRRYRGHRVPFSCFALQNSFSAVSRASGPAFMICAPGLVFGGTEGVVSHFNVLRSRTYFRRYRGVGPRFHDLSAQTRFRRYLGRRILFSCVARPDSFSAVPRSSCPVFMFCTP
jgi:hypothetical protein